MENDITAVFTIRLNMDDMAMLLARAMGRPVQVPFEVAAAAIDRVTATVGAATASASPASVEAVEVVEAVVDTTESRLDEAGGPNVRSDEPETGTSVPAEKPSPGRRARAAAAPVGFNSPVTKELKPSTPPPPPAPLSEFELRALLSKVGQSHPKGVKGVIEMLELHGGHRRLSECDKASWPAIEAAARAALDQYGKRGAAA